MRLGLSTSLSGLKPREWAEKLQKAGCGSVVFPVDYTASDEWFGEFVYQVVVNRQYLDAETVRMLKQEKIALEPWDPMGTLA